MRSKQEEALLRRARKLMDLGDQLKSIREEVEQIALGIYDVVGEDRERERPVALPGWDFGTGLAPPVGSRLGKGVVDPPL
jgi:hypothetical protein